jgi:uncharacterized protein (TIGR02145 family)
MKTFYSTKIYLFCIALLLSSVHAFAFDYFISFSGFGAGTNVDSVQVQNLTNGTTVTVPMGNALILNDLPNTVDKINADIESVSIYPNPSQTSSTLTFNSTRAGITQIMAYSLDGRNTLSFSGKLEAGQNSFNLSLPAGMYNIQINGDGFRYNAKAVSQSLICSAPQISLNGLNTNAHVQKVKSVGATNMFYTAGDQLLFKGYSGKNLTVVTDKPSNSKTISFEFVECKDADNNYYGVVRIGDQIWMLENLKTTKYNDGTAILNVSDSTTWANSVNGSYCWYNYDIKNKDVYGALYNWQSVGTTKLAPTGWHVAYDEEWTEMENYLTANGYNFDGTTSGNKMAKSLASSTLWQGNIRSDTTIGSIANNMSLNNSSGFSAIPSGSLYENFGIGVWLNGGYVTNWWTASAQDTYQAWSRDLYYDTKGMFRYSDSYKYGKSVRCVRYTGNSTRVITNIPSSITTISAIGGGNVVYEGSSAVTARGVCWSTTPDPTITLSTKTNEGSGSGTFVSTMTGLTLGTTYYVRAYATNGSTTTYGAEQQFTTPLNEYAGDYSCVGYRIRPGNPTEPVIAGTIERLNATNSTTIQKSGFGNYTAFDVKIEVTTNTIVVGGVTCYMVNATPVNPSTGLSVGGMFTTWTGDAATLPTPPTNSTEINYYNPVTKTFVLNCYYSNGAGNRIMYEVLTRM